MGELIMGLHSYGTPVRRGNMNTITIGKYCSIAEGVVMDSGFNHKHGNISTYPFHRLFPEIESNIEHPGDIIIGNDVWIAEGAMIMGGVTIGDGAVIGARSVVTKNTIILPYSIWAGVPARFIKYRNHWTTAEKLLKLKWWDKPALEIAKIAPLLVSERFEELFNLYNI